MDAKDNHVDKMKELKLEKSNAMVEVMCPPCPLCHKRGKVTVNAVEYLKWQSDPDSYIQDAMPSANADTREQLISGTHPECWNKLFGAEE